MNRVTNRWARLALITCAAAVVVGCDKSETAFLDQQANAVAVRLGGGSGAEVAEQITTAGEGSLPVNIQSMQLLGEARLSDARSQANALYVNQSEADRLVSRIASLTALAGATATMSDTYRQMEPRTSISMITDLSAKARGDGNTQKFADLPSSSIPTLSAVKQEKSRLEGEIAKAQGELDTATTQRDALLTQVGTLAAQADQQKGEEKLATVKQAADLRQQAAVISRTINEHTALLDRLKSDLAVQSMLESQLGDAVKSFDAQRAALETGWKVTSEKVVQQTQLADAILKADASESAESVKSLIGQLNELLKQVDQQREQALSSYGDAAAKFSAAVTASNEFSQSVSNAKSGGGESSEAAAWAALADALNVERYNLQKAVAKREEAAVHASHARFLLHMADVASSLEAVSEGRAAVPEPFSSQKLKADATEAVKKADELLEAANNDLAGITAASEGLKAIRPLKWSTQIFTHYDRALLSQLASAAGLQVDVAKETVYTESINNAKAAIGEAREQQVAVPHVPAEIYVEAPKPVEEKPAETAAGETASADSPIVAEVRKSLVDLVNEQADGAGDEAAMEAFFTRVKSDETSQPLIDALRQNGLASIKVTNAVKGKFGDEGVAALEEARKASTGVGKEQVLGMVEKAPITSSDETHAEVALPPPASLVVPSVKMVKEEEIWKFDLTQLSEEIRPKIEQAVAAIAAQTEKANTLATDIEGGKYATIDEVKAAIAAAASGTAGPAETPVEEAPAGNTGGSAKAPSGDVGDPSDAPPATPPNNP